MEKPIAVLGAGNGGYAMAGDLASRGYTVHFYEHPRFAAGFGETRASREITLVGALGEKKTQVTVATTDMREALAGAGLVNLVVPSTAQRTFFAEIIPRLAPDQTLVIWAGRFGSLELLQLLREQGLSPPCTIAEVDTLPYGVRKGGASTASILYTARRLYVATIPRSRRGETAGILAEIWPGTEPLDNVLAVAFSNPATLVFGIGALLNAARIQHTRGRFYLFAEGITEAVAEVMYTAYTEIAAVAACLGFTIPPYSRGDFDGPTSLEGICFQSPRGAAGFAEMDGPADVRGRYMMENIGDVLVPIAQLGDLLGVATPVIDAVVTLGSVVCAVDFRREGRNLTRLGLEGMAPEVIVRMLETGETNGED